MIGDLALVYDWCFDVVSPTQRTRVARVREPGRPQRVEPDQRDVGRQGDAVDAAGRSTTRRTTTTTRSCARRCCSASRRTASATADGWLDRVPRHEAAARARPDVRHAISSAAARARAPATASRCATCSSSTTSGRRRRARTSRPRRSTRARRWSRSCTRRCRRSIAWRRPAISRATRRRRSSTTTAHYLQELISLFPTDPIAPHAQALLAQLERAGDEPAVHVRVRLPVRQRRRHGASLDGLGTAYYAPGIGELYTRSGWDNHATWVNLIAGPYTAVTRAPGPGRADDLQGWLALVRRRRRLALRAAQEVDAHGLSASTSGGSVRQTQGTTSQLSRSTRAPAGARGGRPDAGLRRQRRQAAARDRVPRARLLVIYDRVHDREPERRPGSWRCRRCRRSAARDVDDRRRGTRSTSSASRRDGRRPRRSRLHGDSDFTGGFRLDEQIAGGDQRWLHVVWIDGAVSSVSAHDANTVDLMVGGKTVRVSFDPRRDRRYADDRLLDDHASGPASTSSPSDAALVATPSSGSRRSSPARRCSSVLGLLAFREVVPYSTTSRGSSD